VGRNTGEAPLGGRRGAALGDSTRVDDIQSLLIVQIWARTDSDMELLSR